MNKKNYLLILVLSVFIGVSAISFSASAEEAVTADSELFKEFSTEISNPPVSAEPSATSAPEVVKDEKALKAEIKARKKEIDLVRKESRSVLREIKKLRTSYEKILKKMQKDSSSVMITSEELEQAKKMLEVIGEKETSIASNSNLVKSKNSTYSAQYRSKNYQGALETYEEILVLENQLLSDYETVKSYYVDILTCFHQY